MPNRYATHEAKARFSELLRKVRDGARIIITFHGTDVAEIRPLKAPGDSEAAAIRRLEEQGIVTPRTHPKRPLRPLARRPGALKRFLAERE